MTNWLKPLLGIPKETGPLSFAFDHNLNALYVLGIAIVLLLLTYLSVWRPLKSMQFKDRLSLTLLRLVILCGFGLLLLKPQIIAQKFDPSKNYVALVFDDSLSMSIKDESGKSRGDRIREKLEANKDLFEQVLDQRYQLVYYGFGHDASRIHGYEDLNFNRSETNISRALHSVAHDFQGLNLASVLLFSDGIPVPASTKMPNIPIIAIGSGAEPHFQDLAIDQVGYKRSFSDQRHLKIQAQLSAKGLANQRVKVDLIAKDQVLASQVLEIDRDRETHQLQLQFVPEENGFLSLRVRAQLQNNVFDSRSNDHVPDNNEKSLVIDNRRKKIRILYFSGRPNWENKFTQNAVKKDPEIDMTNVLRISAAQTKFVYRGKKSSLVNPLFDGFYEDSSDQPRYDEAVFLRFGGDAKQAGKGFPEDEAELFAYDLVILGDIEASFFSQNQLLMLREFVRKRGGSLLLLGGPHSFSEGGWKGNLLESILPVVLKRPPKPNPNPTTSFRVNPTVEGLLDGSWALSQNPDQNQISWSSLPNLTGINEFSMIRPGATVLANAEVEGEMLPLFASQPYGDGQVAVLANGSTWVWHMYGNDNRHMRIWRQLIRSLTQNTKTPTYFRNLKDHYVQGQSELISTMVRDKRFDPQVNAQLNWTLKQAKKEPIRLNVEESLEEKGHYSTQFNALEKGLYFLSVKAKDQDNKVVGETQAAIYVDDDQRELENPAYNPNYLRSIADQFFELDQLASIPDKIPNPMGQQAGTLNFPLWYFPPFYFIFIALLCIEWYYRRIRGRA